MAKTMERNSTWRRIVPKTAVLLVGLALAFLVAAGLMAFRGVDGAAPAREITLAARDVRFDSVNPPLELTVGEKVALTSVNGESAIAHDFGVAGLGVRTTGYVPPGASETLVFTPTKPGTYSYSCSLHPGLMDGQVVVQAR